MVTIKAACKVFLMDLTQVYKILRLYFASGKKKIHHHHHTCSLRWDKCGILTKHQSRSVGQVGSIYPQGEKNKMFSQVTSEETAVPGPQWYIINSYMRQKKQGKDTVGDTATCEEQENFFSDDNTLLSLPNPPKKEYWSATSKTLSKHWRKTKRLNFHLIF